MVPNSFIVLHVLRVIVQTCDGVVIAIILQLLELTETFKMVNRHQKLRQISNSLKLSTCIILELVLKCCFFIIDFLTLHLKLSNVVIELHGAGILLILVLSELLLHIFEVRFLVLQLLNQISLQLFELVVALNNVLDALVLVSVFRTHIFQEVLILLNC